MNSPEQRPDLSPEQREEILNRSPLLRTFIDRSKPAHLWAEEAGIAFVQVEGELKRTQKERSAHSWGWAMVIVPHIEKPRLYNESFSDFKSYLDVVWPLLTSLFLIGYEIGNREEAILFMPDVLKKLDDIHFFKSELFDSDEGRNQIFDHVVEIIEKGVEIKKELLKAEIKGIDKKEPEGEEKLPKDDDLAVFREFVNSLDF